MNLEKIFKKYLRTNDWTVANIPQTNAGTWWKTIAGKQHQINIMINPLRFNLYVHETIGGNRNHFITTAHVIDFFDENRTATERKDFIGIVQHFIELKADIPLQVIMDKTATSPGEQAELDAEEEYLKSRADADYDQDKLISEYDPH